MNKSILTESTKSNFKVLDKKPANVLKRIQGVLSDFKSNRNGRIYPRELWENVLNSDYVKEMIESHGLVGELDHPEERLEISLQNVSHVINDMWIEGDQVIGTIDILPTPSGKIVSELLDYGTDIGISSRGAGSVGAGNIVDPDYQFVTFDFVARPSCEAARLNMIVEGVQVEIDNNSDDKVNSILESYKTGLKEDNTTSLYIDIREIVKYAEDYLSDKLNSSVGITRQSDGQYMITMKNSDDVVNKWLELHNLNEAKTVDFKDMVMELHSYVEADPGKISRDLKDAIKNNTLTDYLKSKAAMTDDEIKEFKNKYSLNEAKTVDFEYVGMDDWGRHIIKSTETGTYFGDTNLTVAGKDGDLSGASWHTYSGNDPYEGEPEASMKDDVMVNIINPEKIPNQKQEKEYGLLSRLKSDCDYFLGNGNGNEKDLWAHSVDKQIDKMRELYNQLEEKPEWLTLEDIDSYEQRMKSNKPSLSKNEILSKVFARYPDISEEDEDYLNSLSDDDLISEIKNRGWNDILNESTYIIKQNIGSFGLYSVCEWEADSPEQAVSEFLDNNPAYKDGHYGQITAVLKENDNLTEAVMSDQEVYKVVLNWYKQQIEAGKMSLNQCYQLLSDKAKVSLNKMIDQSKIKESLINNTIKELIKESIELNINL